MSAPPPRSRRGRWRAPDRVVGALMGLVSLIVAGCAGSRAAPSPMASNEPASVRLAASGSYDGDLDRLGALLTSRPVRVVAPPAEAPVEASPPPSGPPYTTGPRPGSPVVIPPPALPPGDGTVYAIGDSVLVGAANFLPTTLRGWDLRIDGRVGRRMPEGLSIVQQNRASLGQVAVIVLGHNYGGGGSFAGLLDQLLYELRGVQRVVLVTVAEFAPPQVEVNRAIWAATFRYRNVVVADWAGTVAANPQFLVADRVHPNTAGQVALANLIAVLVGPAPARHGVVPPPPRILPIPDPVTPSPAAPPGVVTTSPPAVTTPGTGTSTTSTTMPAPTEPVPTTTAPPPTSEPPEPVAGGPGP